MDRERQNFLPKIHSLNLIRREYQTNLNRGKFYKITGLDCSKVLRS